MLHLRITTGGKTPIYRQIIDQMRSSIALGKIGVGESLPSVRALAAELVVNPNTIAKAYAALVNDGVIESKQGRGYFVAKRREIFTKRERKRRLDQVLGPFVAEAVTLGYDQQQLVEEIEKHFQKLTKS